MQGYEWPDEVKRCKFEKESVMSVIHALDGRAWDRVSGKEWQGGQGVASSGKIGRAFIDRR